MNIGHTKTWILRILGTIVVGAFGSGLWDVAVKPGGLRLVQVTLSVVTLGSGAVKDRLYREAARGPHEGVALFALSIVLAMYVAMPFFYALLLNRIRRLENRLQPVTTPEPPPHKNRPTVPLTAAILLAFVGFGWIAVRLLMLTEANETYAFFTQARAVCRPYIDENEDQMLASRFASMRNRDDFLVLFRDFQRIASSKHLTLPDYKPW